MISDVSDFDLGSAFAGRLSRSRSRPRAFASAQGKPDRSKPPAIGPAPSLKMPAIQKQKLSNGLAVWIVEHHEVPLAQINLIVRSGSAADPIGKYGVGSLAAAMLDEGAGTRNPRSSSPTRSSSSARTSRRRARSIIRRSGCRCRSRSWPMRCR